MNLELWGGITIIAIAIVIVGCMIYIIWPPADLSSSLQPACDSSCVLRSSLFV